MANETTVVHVTHEAAMKIGGIGAVLHGFFTCQAYLDAVERSIIIGPLFSSEGPVQSRLGEDGEVLYLSADGLAKTWYSQKFEEIENDYHTNIVYGGRTFTDSQSGISSSPEVLLIDVRNMNPEPINNFKRNLYEQFGICSDLYENVWEYEQYVRLAPAAIAALKAIGAADDSTVIISHEYMGMPTALAAIIEPTCNFKTVFHAHEVAPMRRIVEKHPGHNTMFYNVIRQERNNGLYVNDVFGDQSFYFKYPLVEASKYCDARFSVGDYTADELRFLGPEFKTAEIDIVYNGIPAHEISLNEKLNSKGKLQKYCENLLGYKPDFVFTHVTRLVQSKGLWRDLQILYNIEKQFRELNKTAVMFLLSTETAQRPICAIETMESAYGWPVAHREGMSDLTGGEAEFYALVQKFNARSRNIKVIYINQFGFEQKYCGRKMPEDMEFMDIRKGSDVEFGLSIYEPFGISQLEPLSFGGICVVSSVCGCAGFFNEVADDKNSKNVIIADYTDLKNNGYSVDIENPLEIGRSHRREVEDHISEKVSTEIIRRLPKTKPQVTKMIQTGYSLAKQMSWEVVVKKHILKGLHRILYQ